MINREQRTWVDSGVTHWVDSGHLSEKQATEFPSDVRWNQAPLLFGTGNMGTNKEPKCGVSMMYFHDVSSVMESSQV